MKIEKSAIDSSYITWTGLSDVKTKTHGQKNYVCCRGFHRETPRIVNL